ncbi:hypothetical protein U1Q18_047184 [Sarracenia purpurea var. burkii]
MELDPKVSTTHSLERSPNLAASPLLIPGDHPFRIYLFRSRWSIQKESCFKKTLTERDRAVYSDQVVQCFLQVGWFLKLQKNRAATSLLAAFSAQTTRACEGWTLTHDRMALVFKVCKPCLYLN